MIIEGEVAAIDADGKTSWEALQGKDPTLAFFAFDCMYCDGQSFLDERGSMPRVMSPIMGFREPDFDANNAKDYSGSALVV